LLELLQRDASLTTAELAAEVNLSHSHIAGTMIKETTELPLAMQLG
jgi:DNA-binding Lrp family transcriptional regulator